VIGFATVPDTSRSLVHGVPLAEEPGLGTLTLAGWLRDVTTRFGSREALVQHRPNVERWSYADLWARAMEFARALIACGVGKGTRVGILMTNRVEFVTAFFGTALAGGVAVPLSTFSTAPELDQLLTASAVSVLLVEPRVLKRDFLAMIEELAPEIAQAPRGAIASLRYPYLRSAVALDSDAPIGGFETWRQFLARGDTVSERLVEARAATVAPADPGALFFSSGTTGKPKGILNAQRGIAIQLWRWPRIFGLDEAARCWVANGFFWSGPFGMGIGGALSIGGTLVLQSTFQPEQALALMEAERVNCPMGWPHQWAQLAAASNWNSVDFSAMRYVAAENPIARHPTVKVDWPEPTRIYGNTETFTLSSGYCSGTPEEILKDAHGFPLPGMTIKVVDPFSGVTLPIGERGELAVKGATLMLGYVGVPLDETLDEEGYFRTGDGGTVDAEGRVYWEGRLNDIIKTGGANVSPVEIDALLLQCPGVKLSQTVGVPDDLLGELVVSCVLPHTGVKLDEATIRDFARKSLASFKVPRRVLFLAEKDFAQTGSAKVKTAELRKLAAERLAQC
jgi:acyl-CoA synthetase (AMP-forming)/AMP-acid ligase II